MRKIAIIKFILFFVLGTIHSNINAAISEGKGKSSVIKRGLKKLPIIRTIRDKWKEVKKNRDTENVLNALKKINAVSKSSKISKVYNATTETAQSAKQIIFIQDSQNNFLVIKRFNSLEGFQEEKIGLDTVNKNVVPIIKALKATCKLPTITSGKAYPNIDKIGVVVLEAGLGDTLYDRFIENLSKVPDGEISEAFTTIGEQFGCLDREFYKTNEMILVHGDAHARNFTYDFATKTLYWIDTSGMRFSKNTGRISTVTGINLLEFLFQIAGSKERFDQLQAWLKKANKYQEDTTVDDISALPDKMKSELKVDLDTIKNARKNDHLAIESFKKAYISINPEQEADCNKKINDIWGSFDAKDVDKYLDEYTKLLTN